MASDQRPEKLKLVIDPQDRDIFGARERAIGPEIEPGYAADAEPGRRAEGAAPELGPLDAHAQAPRGRAVSVIVAVIVLVGLAGIVWYAFDWGVGQVETARLPVILAEPGPIKSRPESPGGLDVPHRDKLVLNELSPDPEKPLVERLLPPPETPKPPQPSRAAEAPMAAAPVEIEAGPITGASPPPPSPDDQPAPGKSVVMTPEAAAPPPADAPEPPEPVASVPAPPEPAASAPEPAEAATSAPAAETTAQPPPPAPDVQTAARTPSVAPSGAYVVQLAALRARDSARPAWARLQKAHPMFLGDKELTIQEVDLGERGIFYRVQAGFFPDRAGASALCQALKARQQDCLVVKR